jgi:hypothetical protein
MKEKDREFWRKSIENRKKYMQRHHQSWASLLEGYEMRYTIPGIDDPIKISRFVPKLRKIVAAIAFNYPTIFLKVDDPPVDPNTQKPIENISEILQRGANDMIEIMVVKPEIHQMLFDALFKYRGWIKGGYNPPGSDSVLPWVANDYLEDDFPYVSFVPAENMYPDLFTKPNNISSAKNIVEEMLVPLEFAKKDDRFAYRGQMKPYNGPDKQKLMDTYTDASEDSTLPWAEEEKEQLAEALQLDEYVLLHEVHDRVHRRRITFCNDIEQPIEDTEHPFAYRQPVNVPNPATGVPMFSGDTEEEIEGFLYNGGFCYYTMQIDLSSKFYGTPVMGYQNDLQNLIVESLSRRVDIADRGKTILLMNKAEVTNNDEIAKTVKNADDQEVVTVQDYNNFKEVTLGTVPPEQHRLEQDARQYENELLEVGAVQTNTATEAAAFMSDAQLNREWMQTPVQEAYSWIVESSFSLMADPRYTPEQWNLNMAKEGEAPIDSALQNWWLTGRHRVEIQAGSMQILVEQLRRDDTLQLAGWLANRPEIDQKQLIEMVIDSFNVGIGHDLFIDDINADAVSAANLEHQLIMLGQDVPALNGQDHKVHHEQHTKWMQEQLPQLQQNQMNQQVQQGMQQGQNAQQIMQQAQQQAQQVIQRAQAHLQQHVQMIEQAGQQLGTRAGGGAAAAAAAGGGPSSIQSQVNSNAQKLASAAKAEAS